MRYLYYCNSAYQLLTIMNLHHQRKNANFENIDNYQSDLLILNNFMKSEDIYEIVKDNKIFDNVVLVDKAYNKGPLHSLYTIMDIISPSFYLNDKYNFPFSMKNRYDVICVPKYSALLGAIVRLNKKARLDLYEDGLASYFLKSNHLLPSNKMYRLLYNSGFVKDFTRFDRLYLNKGDLYTGLWKKPIIEIPNYDSNYLECMRSYFEDFSKVENEDEKDIYWLAQTLENDNAIKTINSVLNSLEKHKDRVLYCPHPRWPEKDNPIFDMAPDKQIWEMKLLNMKDVDNKLFISIHSTACMTPKMLFDKEPYLILFYPMIDEEVTDGNKQFRNTIELFKDTYRDKTKVMTPKTIEEFENCVSSFINKHPR